MLCIRCFLLILSFFCPCVQISEILRQESQWKGMSGHVDEFIVAVLMQLRLLASRRMANEGLERQQVEKLYSSVVNSLGLVRTWCQNLLKQIYNIPEVWAYPRVNKITVL